MYTGDTSVDKLQCLEVKWDFNSVLPIEEQMPGLFELTVIPDVLEYSEDKIGNFRVKILRPLAKDDFSGDMIKLVSDQEYLITWGYG